jgi:hypothetical protein
VKSKVTPVSEPVLSMSSSMSPASRSGIGREIRVESRLGGQTGSEKKAPREGQGEIGERNNSIFHNKDKNSGLNLGFLSVGHNLFQMQLVAFAKYGRVRSNLTKKISSSSK